eukprot:Nk52_evm30s355 gene=Nk52_evmTU30s355
MNPNPFRGINATPRNTKSSTPRSSACPSRSSSSSGYSEATQKLLSRMINKNDNLTAFQKRQLMESAKSGDSLPLKCHPDSSFYHSYDYNSRSESAMSSATASQKSTIVNPRNIPANKGIKTRESILKDSPYERDPYRPLPSKYDSEKERRRLQNQMAFGTDYEKKMTTTKDLIREMRAKLEEEGAQGAGGEEQRDEFEEIWGEIEERREFLETMRQLGRGKEYEGKIMTEINLRMSQLRKIDAKKNRELKLLEEQYEKLQQQKKKKSGGD